MIFEFPQSFGGNLNRRRIFPRKQGAGTAIGRRREKFRSRQGAKQQNKQRRRGGKSRIYRGAFFVMRHFTCPRRTVNTMNTVNTVPALFAGAGLRRAVFFLELRKFPFFAAERFQRYSAGPEFEFQERRKPAQPGTVRTAELRDRDPAVRGLGMFGRMTLEGNVILAQVFICDGPTRELRFRKAD